MAKKRKTARKTARKAKTRTIKRTIAATSARGVKRNTGRKTKPRRVKASKSLAGRMVEAVKEAASLRRKLVGHDTFED